MGTQAIQVPAMVHAHQSYLQTPLYIEYLNQMMTYDLHGMLYRMEKNTDAWESLTPEQQSMLRRLKKDGVRDSLWSGAELAKKEAERLNIATLFHVSESMLSVAVMAALKLDGLERWDLDVLPSRTGFCVFERPLYHLDAREVQTAFGAYGWHVYTRQNGEVNIEFTLWAPKDDPHDAYAVGAVRTMNLGPFHFLQTGAMSIQQRIGPMLLNHEDKETLDEVMRRAGPDYEPDQTLMQDARDATPKTPLVDYPIDCINVHRVIYAIFLLMGQTIVDVAEYTDRKLARRIKNRRTRPFPMVTIIRLRRPETFGAIDPQDGVWKMNYRTWVRAHWRRQHYGDGSTKKIWIHTYLRGPENAPIHQPERVTTLMR
jgi:hypothetical protein